MNEYIIHSLAISPMLLYVRTLQKSTNTFSLTFVVSVSLIHTHAYTHTRLHTQHTVSKTKKLIYRYSSLLVLLPFLRRCYFRLLFLGLCCCRYRLLLCVGVRLCVRVFVRMFVYVGEVQYFCHWAVKPGNIAS